MTGRFESIRMPLNESAGCLFLSKVSKQELYLVKENYEIFSTEVSVKEKQGQNSGEPHQGLNGSFGISSAIGPF